MYQYFNINFLKGNM